MASKGGKKEERTHENRSGRAKRYGMGRGGLGETHRGEGGRRLFSVRGLLVRVFSPPL